MNEFLQMRQQDQGCNAQLFYFLTYKQKICFKLYRRNNSYSAKKISCDYYFNKKGEWGVGSTLLGDMVHQWAPSGNQSKFCERTSEAGVLKKFSLASLAS
jgi:hypothetical protein